MTRQELFRIAEDTLNKVMTTIELKNKDYGADDDALDNFYKSALMLDRAPFEIWAVYFFKHVDGIMNSIKKNPEDPTGEAENIEHRIQDGIAYLAIAMGILKDIQDRKAKGDVLKVQ